MSTYDYKCQDCGHQFEKSMPIHDHDKYEPVCPKCNSKKVQQLFGAFFAKTDSKT